MKQANRSNRIRYGLYAPVYDVVAKPLLAGHARAIDKLSLHSDDDVLLLGCATGADIAHLPDGVSVTAVDLTPAMVERTRAQTDALDRDVEVRVEDAQSLSLPPNEFDAIALHLVLSVVREPRAVVEEAERVLAPGGRVSIYDKFVLAGERPSLTRRALHPPAWLAFSDPTRLFAPLFEDVVLTVGDRETFLGGLYTVAIAGAD